jgi:hypothetical protein
MNEFEHSSLVKVITVAHGLKENIVGGKPVRVEDN